jgi:hypothetical protein
MTRHNIDRPKVALPALWDDVSRGVSASALARCQRMQREAADAEDYEAASVLKQLIAVLRPQPARSAIDCSPTGAAAKAQVRTRTLPNIAPRRRLTLLIMVCTHAVDPDVGRSSSTTTGLLSLRTSLHKTL